MPETATPLLGEITEFHTRLLRLGLAAEESRDYWINADPVLTQPQRIERAFSERWFGSRSMRRVIYVVQTLDFRFLTFPDAFAALHERPPADPVHRRLVCHWHVQLTDPLYRDFSGQYLASRRLHPQPTADIDAVVRWLNQRLGDRWAPATTRRMATGLLGTATEAGLCEKGALVTPSVPDAALSYLMYLLRGVSFEGTLVDNPYLSSVALDADTADARLRRGLPGVGLRRVADVREFDWQFDGLRAWAEGVKR